MKLGKVEMVAVSRLKPNPRNAMYFVTESGQYFNRLNADIKKRGIQVPLVAKADGTLLAGHNRLMVAKALKMPKVPVQRVIGKISENDETEFIIKDNLLRRHLMPAERESLYRQLYKDFGERILVKGSSSIGISSKHISEITGLGKKTVDYDLTRIRRREQKRINGSRKIDVGNEKEIANYKKAVARMLNVSVIEKGVTLKTFFEITKSAMSNLEKMS